MPFLAGSGPSAADLSRMRFNSHTVLSVRRRASSVNMSFSHGQGLSVAGSKADVGQGQHKASAPRDALAMQRQMSQPKLSAAASTTQQGSKHAAGWQWLAAPGMASDGLGARPPASCGPSQRTTLAVAQTFIR
jgi:hypothetical protein